jgi:ribosomal protein L37AE/L43A
MSAYKCPYCRSVTVYRAFSGGTMWDCPECDADGEYPADGEGLPRATLLRTPEGAAELREQMREEIARRKAPR